MQTSPRIRYSTIVGCLGQKGRAEIDRGEHHIEEGGEGLH